MSDTQMVHYWLGRPLDELTREELIRALIETNRELLNERKRHMQSLDLFGVLGKRPANTRDAG